VDPARVRAEAGRAFGGSITVAEDLMALEW
jgi:hypothetical protein